MIKYILISLFLISCSKETEIIEIGFSAAYVNSSCMGSSPHEVVLTFDNGTVILPVKEVYTGIVSTSKAIKEKGESKLLNVEVLDLDGNIVSYYKHEHDSEWVVVTTGMIYKGEEDFNINGQLFCDGWNKG